MAPSPPPAGPPFVTGEGIAVNIRSAFPRVGRQLRKYAQRAIKLLRRPWGLPSNITVNQYRKDPVCYLSTFNYKVAATIGSSTDSDQAAILTVLTRAPDPTSFAPTVSPFLIGTICVPQLNL